MVNRKIYCLHNRALIQITGLDALRFLQNLITNDLDRVAQGLIYAALLTPQGKYLFDFFILKKSETDFIIDISSQSKKDFLQRLKLYKLRADVNIKELDGKVGIGFRQKPNNAFIDPRCEQLGWRQYFLETTYPSDLVLMDHESYKKLRVEHRIPETGVELIQNKTFILEAGFERLTGVCFKKGCYVGQEVTARMRHKTELQKGLAKVRVIGKVNSKDNDIFFERKIVGRLFTRSEEYAIAYLKFRYEKMSLKVGDADLVFVERF